MKHSIFGTPKDQKNKKSVREQIGVDPSEYEDDDDDDDPIDKMLKVAASAPIVLPPSPWGYEKDRMPKKPEGAPAFKDLGTPDDEQHKLWYVYKYGDADPEMPNAGDKDVRARIFGQYSKMMHKATVKGLGMSHAPIGRLRNKARTEIYKAIESYDPSTPTRTGEVPKLGKHIYNRLFYGAGSSVTSKEVARVGSFKAFTEGDFGQLSNYRRAWKKFTEREGRTPTIREMVKETGLELNQVERIYEQTGSERMGDTIRKDDDYGIDRSLVEKAAIQAVFADLEREGRKDEAAIMKHMYAAVLGGTPPPKLFDAGAYKWIAKQVGVPQYTVSRRKKEITRRIDEAMAALS